MAKLARILLAGLFLLVPFASGILAQSQATTGVIEGAVLDASGGALPGATVTIRNTGTGFEHVVTTDTQGRFRVVQLPLGPYRVTVSMTGFANLVRDGLRLEVGQTISLP